MNSFHVNFAHFLNSTLVRRIFNPFRSYLLKFFSTFR